jgi:hypothetical protein
MALPSMANDTRSSAGTSQYTLYVNNVFSVPYGAFITLVHMSARMCRRLILVVNEAGAY